jgi:phosphate transport system substrate-binding protein
MKRSSLLLAGLSSLLSLALTSCGDKSSSGGGEKKSVKVSGSNTMAQVGQSWAENFTEAKVSVAGGGSGIGITELTEGRIDICTSSRPMKPEEKEKLKAKQGKDAVEFVVGYDALAIFVHPSNPIKEISMEQLKEIYVEGGAIATWEQVSPGGATGNVEALGRESTSGTYEFIHDAVLGKNAAGEKNKFRTTVAPQSSSQAIIDNLASIKNAIGYDGMAFKTDKVKWIAVSKKTGEPSVMPGVDDARSGKYPLARKLYLYTAGQPEGATKAFIDFALSAQGQKLLADTGYVSLK